MRRVKPCPPDGCADCDGPCPTAGVLPAETGRALVAASRIRDRAKREKAINDITDRSKKKHPHLFKE